MKHFRNIISYKITQDIDLSDEVLEQALSDGLEKMRFIEPIKGCGKLYHRIEDYIYLAAEKEFIKIPSSAVNREFNQRVEKFEKDLARKLNKDERDNIKQDIVARLSAKAIKEYRYFRMIIDTKNNHILIDETSTKQAEDLLHLLRKCLGKLPVAPLAYAEDISVKVKYSLLGGGYEGKITFSKNNLKISGDDGELITLSNADNDIDVNDLLVRWRYVQTVKCEYKGEGEDIYFTLCKNGNLKSLKAFQTLDLEGNKQKEDDFDADLIYMMGEYRGLFEALADIFGGEEEVNKDEE